jgi:plastocyanin
MLALAGCADPAGTLTRMEVHFDGHGADFSADVRSHLDDRPLSAQYERDGVPHPDAYTVHDQIEEWSRQTHKTYATTSFPDSGFGAGYFLTGIDGVSADGSSAYWSLSVNGEPSTKGMSEVVVAEGDTVTWTYTTTGAQSSSGGSTIQLEPLAPTQEDKVMLKGTVDGPAALTVIASRSGGDVIAFQQSVQAEGAWSLTVPLDPGHNDVEVFDADGGYGNLTVVRLVLATFEAVYTASPGHDASSDAVWYDPDALLSAPMYEGTDADRASQFTVHDFMVAWTLLTGTPIEYGGPGAFGFSVNRIDGIGQPLDSSLPPYWCYTINGQSADLGISLQPVTPGDIVTWEYGACA